MCSRGSFSEPQLLTDMHLKGKFPDSIVKARLIRSSREGCTCVNSMNKYIAIKLFHATSKIRQQDV